MQRDKEYLLDILEAARFAVSYTGNKTREEFLKDIQCQDAVIRRIEIIGEAARRVSVETRATLKLPWSEMVGMRNLMIHEYDDIDMTTVWVTVRRDLPPLIYSLEEILRQGDDK
ncbi:MAG: hypothetical protein A3C38_07275 [Planctomycetes bacterium RIFCSPHIGHO2_02_FULL_50_42]|nr:MAG: hypothetical protein A2060_04420 [Planctomycetes bacterium GWA2_50_13]OHB88366.1 MAG: hypothetical protein A3C38_07275 [Planctomycetes bacterium RIFCSPHIGHO2_02_FULL_50_42]OHB91823.1 MAG: hypothetical protein A3E75_05230 [Planctomycetes bacterium RIFCSPHIGHO2_12_FULL_51_37]OHB96085.1 MAG: hypothetical protein A3I59_01050 [Planctomycetes bacterium RIFCSPLOWO2_02_FULL_50_16]OHC04505.1 MAG: hypothetical protein A3G17_01220 [Planctomycetes bacterium RIFCSPLOWO2_12_FULL_50_35]